jgi:hypothetical protein
VGYIAAREARGDMILVNLSSNWGFAYYWRVGDPAARPSTAVAQGYEAYFPDQRDIVVVRNRNLEAIDEALGQALAAARRRACSRIWVVRTHLSAQEKLAWRVALRQQKVTLARAGRAGLGVIQVGGPGCR